jgi:hypothetical protein
MEEVIVAWFSRYHNIHSAGQIDENSEMTNKRFEVSLHAFSNKTNFLHSLSINHPIIDATDNVVKSTTIKEM